MAKRDQGSHSDREESGLSAITGDTDIVPPEMEEIFLKYGSEERTLVTLIGNVIIKSGLHGLIFRGKNFDFFQSGGGNLLRETELEARRIGKDHPDGNDPYDRFYVLNQECSWSFVSTGFL